MRMRSAWLPRKYHRSAFRESITRPHIFLLAKGKKQNGGYIEATSLETGKLLWELRVYEVEYDPILEGDVQDVYITYLKIVDGNLEILHEAGDKFVVRLDLAKRKVIKGANRVYRFKDTADANKPHRGQRGMANPVPPQRFYGTSNPAWLSLGQSIE